MRTDWLSLAKWPWQGQAGKRWLSTAGSSLFVLAAAQVAYAVSSALSPALPNSITTLLPHAEVVGAGRFHFALWDIYEARLYAQAGHWQADQPFALSLHYFRELSGKDIADRSVQEIRQQGFSDEVTLAAWNAQLKGIFPDVKDGTVLTGVYLPGEQTIFYLDDQQIGAIKDQAFGQQFFNIWLGEKSSAPALRKQLLGLK